MAKVLLHCVSMTSHIANEFPVRIICGLWFALTYSCGFIPVTVPISRMKKSIRIMETQC